MILDRLENFYKYASINEKLLMAVSYIERHEYETLPVKQQRDLGNGMTAILLEYDTVGAQEKQFELHRHCIDIQYLIKGQETIYFGDTPDLEIKREYRDEGDAMLLSGPSSAELHLGSGMSAVFLPEESHKPGCHWETPSHNKKLVLKILLA